MHRCFNYVRNLDNMPTNSTCILQAMDSYQLIPQITIW